MTIKLDFEKAYDRLECKFIQKIFTDLGFLDKWIYSILECITTVSFSVVNGIPRDRFWPERYKNTLRSGIDIKIAKNGTVIHYLKCADDCFIFCEANRMAAQHLKTILDNYCEGFSQLVNIQKSIVQF